MEKTTEDDTIFFFILSVLSIEILVYVQQNWMRKNKQNTIWSSCDKSNSKDKWQVMKNTTTLDETMIWINLAISYAVEFSFLFFFPSSSLDLVSSSLPSLIPR